MSGVYLRDLSICRIPYTLGTLPNLKAVVLDGNPMKGIRRDIIMVSLLLASSYESCFVLTVVLPAQCWRKWFSVSVK